MQSVFKNVYNRFKLHFDRHIFASLGKEQADMSVMEALAAEVIYALGNPTVGEFAATVGLSAPNASYRVQSLVRKGYVEKIPSDIDRREYHLRVTDKFKKVYTINEEYIEVVAQRMRDRFSKEDIEKFKEMLTVVSEELMPEARIK